MRVKNTYSNCMTRRTAIAALAGSVPVLHASDGGRVPVLVELFTSEGCSSCPPADALLIQLEKQPIGGVEIIPLAEHVDYWNHLGWSDAYSSPVHSWRQQQYANRFKMDSVYTPQIVVNGRFEALGSDTRKVYTAIEQASRGPRATLRIDKLEPAADDASDTVRVRVGVEPLPPDLRREKLELMLAVTESNIASNVAHGENAGRRLRHTGVVRSMVKVAELNSGKNKEYYSASLLTQVAKNWNRANIRAVLFLQSSDSEAIYGATICSV